MADRSLAGAVKTPWLRGWGTQDAEVSLVCLPHAGAGGSIYHRWRPQLPARIGLYAVTLPGREDRFGEPLLPTMKSVVDQLVPQLLASVPRPVVLFGHSLGGMMAHAVARRLEDVGVAVAHLMVSGCRPVSARRMAHLRDPEFIAALDDLGGIPQELIQAPELLRIFLPALRADVRLAEEARLDPDRPVRCPVTALGGTADPQVPWDDLLRWRGYTTGEFRAVSFDGDHFFVGTAEEDVLALVRAITDGVTG
ncbi:thioesterase II family protein [Micromonospora lutea]|uniref:thioesterase II family protein n=1 Tax=Micromonospora lutea TaxID=419825 RepID=UPI0019519CFB|nr:alpha/beta fold hydrolase [Micromonospora lutea]